MNSSISTSDIALWQYIRRLLLCWLCLLMAPAVLVMVVDPYLVFHRSFLADPPFYRDNERYQVPGLIDHYLRNGNYDSVIIGSSLSSNMTTDLLQQQLGWRALNLSVRASTTAERALVLNSALQTGKVRHVLLEISAADMGDGGKEPLSDPAFPIYLYQHNPIMKWRYVFNESTAFHAVAILLRGSKVAEYYYMTTGQSLFNETAWGFNVNQWNAWLGDAEQSGAFAAFRTREARLALKAQFETTLKGQQRDTWKWQHDFPFQNIRSNIINIVRQNPDVEFRLWFGAVSLYRYAGDNHMGVINMYVESRRLITQDLSALPNVKIYSFDNDLDIVGNLNNYMDPSHFSRQVLEHILDEISKDTHRLDHENIHSFCETFRSNILNFDVEVPQQ